jgi:hypothetical protein
LPQTLSQGEYINCGGAGSAACCCGAAGAGPGFAGACAGFTAGVFGFAGACAITGIVIAINPAVAKETISARPDATR